MKVPQLKKKPEIKSCHNITWEDNYSWIHQKNILEVLKDKNKLDPEVKKYLEEENAYTDYHLKDTKIYKKNYLMKLKQELNLDDESLPYKDHTYEYWTKTTTKGNYSIKLRKKIGSNNIEEIWNGDKEKEKLSRIFWCWRFRSK
jgi:oligopeptidase B